MVAGEPGLKLECECRGDVDIYVPALSELYAGIDAIFVEIEHGRWEVASRLVKCEGMESMANLCITSAEDTLDDTDQVVYSLG